MSLEFRAQADISDVEQKLNSLPAKAAAANRKINTELSRKTPVNVTSAAYVEHMKSAALQSMRTKEEIDAEEAKQKLKVKNQAENSRAQAAIDAKEERDAKKKAQTEQKIGRAHV